MKWFSYDSPIMQGIAKAADYAIVNMLWVLCSIPLVTAGAALSARYYVGMKIARDQEPSVIKSFFSSFTRNLKQTLPPGILFVLAGGLLLFDWRYTLIHESSAALRWGLIVITALYMMIQMCFYAIISRYMITTKEAIRAALGMIGAHFARILLAVALFITPFIISIWDLRWAWLICLFVHCVMLHYNSLFFIKEFDRLEEKMQTVPAEQDTEEKKEENTEDHIEDSKEETVG